MLESEIAGRVEQSSPTGTAEPSLVTLSQAQNILRIGHDKITELIRLGEQTGGKEGLRSVHSTLDRRAVFVDLKDVEALRKAAGVPIEDARRQLGVSREKLKAIITASALAVRPHPFYKGRKVVDSESLKKLLSERKALTFTQPVLSISEIEVLNLVALGATNREIAVQLHCSEHAVKWNLESVFQKLSVKDRTAAVVRALRYGLIAFPEMR